MIKKTLFFILFIAFGITSLGQTNDELTKNLDFEQIIDGKAFGWGDYANDGYVKEIDTLISFRGNNSASIEYINGNPNFSAWSYSIPAIYQGKKIKLTAYIKTENVTDGYAGLWMRIDPYVAFDNMNKRGITGTTDWTKYEIELSLNSSKAQQIIVGGLLKGKGKMWLDKLEVTIDGKGLKDVPLKELTAIEEDVEFKDSSSVDDIMLDDQTIDHLKSLGIVWGYLKYYHPNIACGDINWDFELFRILPSILKAENAIQRDVYLYEWINNFGEYELSENEKKEKDEIKLQADLGWIEYYNFSDDLTIELQNILNASRDGNNHYISLHSGIGNPNFDNEAEYSEMLYPDAGYRLLSLYRYWNIIQYYFPYKYLIEEDWKDVLTEFIPVFINAKNETEYKLAVLELIARVHDTHADLWYFDAALNRYWGENHAPIELAFIENKSVVVDYYDDDLGLITGLQIGDIITKINNKSIEDIVNEQLKYTPASNYPTQLRDISEMLLRTNDTIINIEYERNDISQVIDIKTYSNKELNIYKKDQNKDSCFRFINKDIAYLHLGSIKNSYLSDIFDKIEDTKGLIIDLRCYPSEFVVYSLGKYLLPNKTEFVRFIIGDIVNPGQFTFTESISVGKKNKDYYKGKVVVLINESTQSQAEYTTMALRVAPKATVIGSTTAAADGNISMFYLPGGIRTAISGIGVYYPDKTETQRIGIIPDVEVKPTIEGVKNGKDELLEKAIEVIELQE